MSDADTLNPYAPLALPHGADHCAGPSSATATWPFQGSMQLNEGGQIAQLIAGKTQKDEFTKSHMLWLAGGSLLFLGWVGVDVVFEDVTEIIELALPLIGIAAVMATGYLQMQRKEKLHAELKQQQKGVFTFLDGEVSEHGVVYRIGDLPVKYAWEDLVGARVHDDAILLYVDYPKEMNFLAASLFQDRSSWDSVKQVIQQRTPQIGRFPRLSKGPKSQRMQCLSAGSKALQQDQWHEAIKQFDLALQIDPDDLQAMQGRMVAAVATHDLELAWDAIESITARGLNDATTRRLRASVLIHKDRFDDAIEELDSLIEEFPDDSGLLRDRGLACLELGRREEALRDTSRSLELQPHDPVAWNNRGATLIQLEQFDAAIEDLQKAIEIAPQFDRPKQLLQRAKSLSE